MLPGGRVEVRVGVVDGPVPRVLAVGLDDNGRLRDGRDLVVPGADRSADGAVEVTEGSVRIDPALVDAGIARVVVAAATGRQGFAGTEVRSVVHGDGAEFIAVSSGFTAETLVRTVELYRHQGRWKLRHLGDGYADGITGLARDIGLELPPQAEPPTRAEPSRPTRAEPSAPRPQIEPMPPVRAAGSSAAAERSTPAMRVMGFVIGIAIMLFFGGIAFMSMNEDDAGVRCGTETMKADDICVTNNSARHTRDEQEDINERGDLLGFLCLVPLALVGGVIAVGSLMKDPD
ncbi:stress response protein SCP2 [Nocardia caishijiensis]|uniref:Stress response protein SCP2 n=1 Tax=Nocardia caishijiensis TaxID=184756 RepID=A0ABQ6YPM5_9NOCA|nr:stress response protein SCP2 [Nocardia caishijiensis]